MEENYQGPLGDRGSGDFMGYMERKEFKNFYRGI